MATVQSVLGRKGRDVVTIGIADTALAAAERMNQRAIGGLVVVDGDSGHQFFTIKNVLAGMARFSTCINSDRCPWILKMKA